MFIVYLVLFMGGMYLFGAAFNAPEGWQAIVFVSGLLAISVALALIFRRNKA